MKLSGCCRLTLRLGVVAALAFLCVDRAETQDRKLNPTFGDVKLKVGFLPDPYVKDLIAGGAIETKLGGVKAFVADAPDFQALLRSRQIALDDPCGVGCRHYPPDQAFPPMEPGLPMTMSSREPQPLVEV